ncbi:hypothetical protein [Amycolatopsis minnesotensis]|uniref:Secreted protein n=1 Tax=Amycolatopsis minnesotensis TaxID=337894 RepID=A0ABN2Q895_9PSEU
MRKTLVRGVVAATLAGAAIVGAAAPALASETPGPVIVDEPDTSGLNNVWTFAPLGVPVLGLIQSVVQAPGKLLPNPTGY